MDSSVGTLCSLSSSQPNVTINEKNDVPSVTKTFDDGKTTNNASIGDVITFNTIVNVKQGAQGYVLHDTMSKGLHLNQQLSDSNDKPVLVSKDNHQMLQYGTDFVFSETTDGFTIKFSDDFLKQYENKEYTLLVMYSATLTDAAVIGGAGNTNETYLRYGVDSESNHSTTTTYTFKIPVFKYTGTDTPLPEAKFRLYTDEQCKTEVNVKQDGTDYLVGSTDAGKNVMTSPQSGEFTIKGLKAGTYYLKEIEAPKGYNLLANAVEVHITEAGKVEVRNGETLKEVNRVDVQNKSGSLLPHTGGAGTTMIYLVGALLVLGSGVVLASKRRSNSK